jgi:hypothetical protein
MLECVRNETSFIVFVNICMATPDKGLRMWANNNHLHVRGVVFLACPELPYGTQRHTIASFWNVVG